MLDKKLTKIPTTVPEMKNASEGLTSRLDTAEARSSRIYQ